MNKILYLHIGLSKTGSTSIQMTCAKNRHILKSSGLLYPQFSLSSPETDFRIDDVRNHTVPIISQFTQYPEQIPQLSRIGCSKETYADIVRSFEQQFTNSLKLHQSTLFSGEGISLMTHEQLKRLRELLLKSNKQLKIIMVVRHPFTQLVSSQNQWLKQYGRSALADRHPMIYQSRLAKKIMSVFSEVKVLLFEDLMKHPQGLVAGFLENINFHSFDQIKLMNGNFSLSNQAVRMIEYLHNSCAENNQPNLCANQIFEFKNIIERIPGDRFHLNSAELTEANLHAIKECKALSMLLGVDMRHKVVDPQEYSDYIDYSREYLFCVMLTLLRFSSDFSSLVWNYFQESPQVSVIQKNEALKFKKLQNDIVSQENHKDINSLTTLNNVLMNNFPDIPHSHILNFGEVQLGFK